LTRAEGFHCRRKRGELLKIDPEREQDGRKAEPHRSKNEQEKE